AGQGAIAIVVEAERGAAQCVVEGADCCTVLGDCRVAVADGRRLHAAGTVSGTNRGTAASAGGVVAADRGAVAAAGDVLDAKGAAMFTAGVVALAVGAGIGEARAVLVAVFRSLG